ncbi:hypothetical protein [Nostoc sp. NMS8]|uniref:hypothetical protein n=1 Tax=Nostoc sp. NMS8 TaxID=2815392 RepID=UPI0025EF7E20|nr:hypothetical protein [Nostoc sp. NMS8]MBN3959025.1 hypothetical protein [Nostoc sp. NMS8]
MAEVSCCDYSLHIEVAREQSAGSKGENLQVLPNHPCDAICKRNSLNHPLKINETLAVLELRSLLLAFSTRRYANGEYDELF